jgi:hypothetical protein
MPQAIRPQVILTQTRDGELVIKMIIELNLNVNGQVAGVATAATAPEESQSFRPPHAGDETEWVIPDFSPSNETISFGKVDG